MFRFIRNLFLVCFLAVVAWGLQDYWTEQGPIWGSAPTTTTPIGQTEAVNACRDFDRYQTGASPRVYREIAMDVVHEHGLEVVEYLLTDWETNRQAYANGGESDPICRTLLYASVREAADDYRERIRQ